MTGSFRCSLALLVRSVTDLGPAVGLEADVVISGDLAEVPLQLLEHLPVAHRLLQGGEGVKVCEAGEAAK